MKKYLFLFLLLLGFIGYAQQKITFSYDSAGNQLLRVLCLSGCNPTAKPAKEIKEIDALTDADLLKFSEEDVISYYPNPVKEELYLRNGFQNYLAHTWISPQSRFNMMNTNWNSYLQYQTPVTNQSTLW